MAQGFAMKLMIAALSISATLGTLAYVGSLNVPTLKSPSCEVQPAVIGLR